MVGQPATLSRISSKETKAYAVLGIAIMLALETWEITETTPVQVASGDDIARMVQEPTKNFIDLFEVLAFCHA